jgi:multiple sugar transport system ATP-binding protein
MGEVNIDQLTKRFSTGEEEILAVDNLDITIQDGEFLVLVGPSGCGKSTTLRSLAGLETVSEGNILLNDEDITDHESQDRNIAMVFQNYALYPHMTAGENIGFGLKMSTNLSKTEIDQRVNETAEMMGIEDLLDQKPGELSGGQQQRVSLGRAIVRDPALFLMDEPLSNLDAKLRTQMRTELQNLQRDLGTTTVYVTHDQTEAMTMGDRIAVLDGGELQQIGSPLECYNKPTNLFVASFIGSPSMNFFESNYFRNAEVMEHEAFTYNLNESIVDELTDTADELVLGIRPEDIAIASGDEPNAIDVTVDVVEPLGNETYVYFSLANETCPASVEGNRRISAGDQISIVFPNELVHIFDRATGRAIKNRSWDEFDVAAVSGTDSDGTSSAV